MTLARLYCLTLCCWLAAMGCSNGGTADGGADAGCSSGNIGCECAANGSCSTGECVAGVCTDCRRGEAACVCRSNGTCNSGLRCGAGSLCEACTAGVEGCACTAQDTCNTGLKCESSLCVADSCVAGTPGCPCKSGDPKCAPSNYCDTSNRCQACSPDVVGCPCGAANVCTGGLVCDGATTTCRAAKTCAELRQNGVCVAHQTCTETSGADATCVAGSCEAGFKFDGRSNTCVPCASAQCLTEPSCSDDAGTAADCAVQNRTCVQSGQVPSCGACISGYTESRPDAGNSVCVPAPQCGTSTCAIDQYCDVSSGTPTCAVLPCPAGQAKSYDVGTGTYGSCVACARQCNGAGYTGRIWPFQTHLGECICETQPGYFVPQGVNGQATVCDADHDGWVRTDADDQAVHNDPALLANARCDIRRVAQVMLVDEYGVGSSVRSCAEGLVMQTADAGMCSSIAPLRLLETARNDIGSVNPAKLPQYGAAGRTLEAGELNSLTKACVSLTGDFNDNGVDDMREVQGRRVISSDDQVRLASFAYFVELYDAYYEPATQGVLGTLVIRERSRCADSFPLRYDQTITDALSTADGYRADAGFTFWRNCSRRRDSNYSQSATEPGYDFAQWNCDATIGSCPGVPPARADAGVTLPVDPTKELIRGIGLCELNGALPADGLWRGFNHHSQFKCVNVTSTPNSSFDHAQGDFAGSNATSNDKLVFNQCYAEPCTAGSCRTTPGVGLQTATPKVHCVAQAPAAGAVGFAAVGFHGYAKDGAYTAQTYQNGCIAEDDESRSDVTLPPVGTGVRSYLCPYPEYCNTLFNDGSCSPALARANDAFGRYSCFGMDPNFLWSDTTPQRATLRWAVDAADTANGYLR